MKIQKLSTHNLRNNANFQFHIEFCSIVTILFLTFAPSASFGASPTDTKCKNVTFDSKKCENIYFKLIGEKTNLELAEEFISNCECWAKKDKIKTLCGANFTYPSQHFEEIKNFTEKMKKINYKLCGETYNKLSAYIRKNRYDYDFYEMARKYMSECKEYWTYDKVSFQKCSPSTARADYDCWRLGECKTNKQELIVKLQKELEKALEKVKQDSMKIVSGNEINTLFTNGGIETNLILDKCNEHLRAFKEQLHICKQIQDSIRYQEYIDEIIALLKANELEECVDKCESLHYHSKVVYNENFDKKITDLCEKQLVAKVKKLPLKKINSNLAAVYFSPLDYEFPLSTPNKNDNVVFSGTVIQNDGKMVLLSVEGTVIMLQHSGQCTMRIGLTYSGYGKYLGEKIYTTVRGAKQMIPNVQLLWCNTLTEN